MNRRLLLGFAHFLVAMTVPNSIAETPGADMAGSSEVPRVVLALYDGRADEQVRFTKSHRWAEMPMNHLGLIVRYHEISEPLPDLSADVRGVLVWVESDAMENPLGFLEWAERAADAGKRFLFMGDFPFQSDFSGKAVPLERMNRFLRKIGLEQGGDWFSVTYDVEFIEIDRRVVGFERSIPAIRQPFRHVRAVDPKARRFLRARYGNDSETDTDLIVVTRLGSFAAGGYAVYEDGELIRRQWILNPFEFFRLAFNTDDLPKPDPTTLSGRRIFYSHIDGDGWRNLTELREYQKDSSTSAEVILEEVLKKFPDLPVTVAPIAGDLDPEWVGDSETLRIARAILALEHVEAGSHTYSHPFEWDFFAGADPEKERPFLPLYKKHWGQSNSIASRLWKGSLLESFFGSEVEESTDRRLAQGTEGAGLQEGFDIPRAYAVKPFDVEVEIQGSVDFVQELLPAGKTVKVLQWSGDTSPFVGALEATTRAGIRNINGGDTRFDREFPSFAWVAPVGRQVGPYVQIYASNSNENTYTDLWTDRYFGFVHLVRTLRNTEVPWRLKPLNVYYHMYSGEKLSSLNALLANLRFVREQPVASATTSEYAAIAEGFFTTRFHRLGPSSWRVEDRGDLQTVRMDHAVLQAVDFQRSKGVVGQRHLNGSLYVALDDAEPRPVISLKKHDRFDRDPEASEPYLVQGRWRVFGLETNRDSWRFRARGFGRGEMVWKVPEPGTFEVTLWSPGDKVRSRDVVETSADGTLTLTIDAIAIRALLISVKRIESS